MTPRTPSESAPTHGLSAIRESFCSNVFDSEENNQIDEENEDEGFGDYEGAKLVKDAGSKDTDYHGDKIHDDDVTDPSASLIQGADNAPRARKESHV